MMISFKYWFLSFLLSWLIIPCSHNGRCIHQQQRQALPFGRYLLPIQPLSPHSRPAKGKDLVLLAPVLTTYDSMFYDPNDSSPGMDDLPAVRLRNE